MNSSLVYSGDTVYVYTLTDPTTHNIRYVGKSTTPSKRLQRHLDESRTDTKSHKKAWINSLLKQNKKPLLQIIDEVAQEEWKFWETYWIQQVKSWGFCLTNTCEGGEGVDKGHIPWNKGIKGSIPANSGSFKKGEHVSPETEIKQGQRLSPRTEFKKGDIPFNAKIVLQYTPEGDFVQEFSSLKEAGNYVGVTYSIIRKNFDKVYRGYLWKPKI